jgi:adenylate cyclase
MQRTVVPDALRPAYRVRQQERLLRNLRASLPAGSAVALFFIPWNRWHDLAGTVPTTQLGLLFSAGLLVFLGMTYLPWTKRGIDLLTLGGFLFAMAMASLMLGLLPDGFLYGVGVLLTLIIVVTVLSVDLSLPIVAVTAVSFFVFPNVSLLLTDAAARTIINTNWILLPGVTVALGLAYVMDQAHRQSFMLEVQLAAEKDRSDALLEALLPRQVAEELKQTDTYRAETVPDAAVLFADLSGFTSLTRQLSADELISILTDVFTALDEVTARHGLEKIKTIGDAYMVSAGVADAAGCTVDDIAAFSLDAHQTVSLFVERTGYPLGLRIGICCGPVVSGVIGRRKPHFDIWGATVNLASRLQSSAPVGCIQIDHATAERLRDRYEVEYRGEFELEGIGTVDTYLLHGRHHEAEAIPATTTRRSAVYQDR